MFKFFKKRCPVCKMELKEKYVEGFGKKFCSEECGETYRKQLAGQETKESGGGCGCC